MIIHYLFLCYSYFVLLFWYQIISPLFPILITFWVDYILSWWFSLGKWCCFLSNLRLSSWLVWRSCLCTLSLLIWPIIQILSPSLPLLFSSWLGERFVSFRMFWKSRTILSCKIKVLSILFFGLNKSNSRIVILGIFNRLQLSTFLYSDCFSYWLFSKSFSKWPIFLVSFKFI